MRNILRSLVLLPLALAPVFGGGMILEIGNAKASPAATAKHGVVVARLTACHTPAKGILSATAEGLVGGKRHTITLKADSLDDPGVWAVPRAWPGEGKWVVRLVASHPEYGDYTSSVVVAVSGDSFDWGKLKRFAGKPPSESDVAAILAK